MSPGLWCAVAGLLWGFLLPGLSAHPERASRSRVASQSEEYASVIVTRMDVNGEPYDDSDVHHDPHASPSPHLPTMSTTNYPYIDISHNATGKEHRYYSLDAFGHTFTLELLPNLDFLAPSVMIQHLDVNRTWWEGHGHVGVHCFHHGKVQGDPDSMVTLSTCHHLHGLILAYGRRFFIELHPEEEFTPHNTSRKTHLIYAHTEHAKDAHSGHTGNTYSDQPGNFHHNEYESACETQESHKDEHWKTNHHTSSDEHWKTNHHTSSGFNDILKLTSQFTSAPAHQQRKKRSVSMEHYVETMVVADAHMVATHGKGLQHYLLTLMSIVHNVYKHPSIGNAINIVVVKLVVLESNDTGPQITTNAMGTLKEFCVWQHGENVPDDKSVKHHDTAILITGLNLCRSASKCHTLGLAELGTVCDSKRSCSITEDTGLSAAFTISHEVGHVFNLPHDDDKHKCVPYMRGGKEEFHVMAPTLDHTTHPWTWSNCSRKTLTEFLDAGQGACLMDKPKQLTYYAKIMSQRRKLPGEVYTANEQCELVFGKGAQLCTHMPSNCRRLWCTDPENSSDGSCKTHNMPWSDGTRCGHHKWCQQGACVQRRGISPIDGSWSSWQPFGRCSRTCGGGIKQAQRECNDPVWSSWQPFGRCSRTCGGGIKQAQRECNDPVPKNGGRYCIGRRVKYRSCNVQDCQLTVDSFRDEQCGEFNGNNLNIDGLPPDVRWVAKYGGIQLQDQCKLFCRVSSSSVYHLLRPKVIDGTKCGPDTSDICVNGQCRRAGCDNRLGSTAKLDLCGVCGGDSTSCRTIAGSFNQVRYGYNLVIRIPKGATNINVQQHSYNSLKEDHNYLALRNAVGEFILNGDFSVSMQRKVISLEGAKVEYSGANATIESITATRTIPTDMEILVLSVGKLNPPDIRYRFTIPIDDPINFLWTNKGPWTGCTAICDGYRKRKVVCLREDNFQIVSDQRCEHLRRKPSEIIEACNTFCSLEWAMIEESECSTRCGEGVKHRRVKCVKRTESDLEYVLDSHCLSVAPKPKEKVLCQGPCLPTHWQFTDWSQCTKSCNAGVQSRNATCVDTNGQILHDLECDQDLKVITQPCNVEPCPEWQTGEWTGCSVTCGNGIHQRHVWCQQGEQRVNTTLCQDEPEPPITQNCSLSACPVWHVGQWAKCSVSCGIGMKMRAVRCFSADKVALKDTECNAAAQPRQEMLCSERQCPTTIAIHTTTTARAPVTEWRTGGWTACSTTCGPGTRERYVSCRDQDGAIADESACDYSTKPPAQEVCVDRPCGEWRTGGWTPCSQTCGEGQVTRYVACVTLEDLEEQIADPAQCDIDVRPYAEQMCNMQACVSVNDYDIYSITSNNVVGTAHWRVGPWGGCSSTCEGGWQQRRVVCQDERGASSQCSEDERPQEIQTCNTGSCPMWNYGEWGECSVSCGGGIQERVVMCQLPNGQSLLDHSCDILERPSNSRRCNLHICQAPASYHWHRGPWSECSVSCGKGHRQREVYCIDGEGETVHEDLCRHLKPKSVKRCRTGRCPRWIMSSWGECSVTCGKGIRQREVRCARKRGESVHPELCVNQTRPAANEGCYSENCTKYEWHTKIWSQCSQTCGSGTQTRRVACINLKNGRLVRNTKCDVNIRPRNRRRCNDHPCPYQWTVGDWSKCSSTCGMGIKSRAVACKLVTAEEGLVHDTLHACNSEHRPPDEETCNPGPCDATAHWRTGHWGACSKSCGVGTARRRVQCMDVSGDRRPNEDCEAELKPAHIQLCYLRTCYAQSCQELKEQSNIRKDGEYNILLHGTLVTLYCHHMRKSHPEEYLTLPAGVKENYAEIYDQRLRDPETCPGNGTRQTRCDQCLRTSYDRAGVTTFSKIRINITSLQVIANDFHFSSTRGTKRVPYGTAGDCYSAGNCAQGQFKVNLSGTQFRVSPHTTWEEYGHKPYSHIEKKQHGYIVEGRCGGYCGRCSPSLLQGLQLDLVT